MLSATRYRYKSSPFDFCPGIRTVFFLLQIKPVKENRTQNASCILLFSLLIYLFIEHQYEHCVILIKFNVIKVFHC